jgi:flavin reductase (DIM6/NTAB) family NADH-FMN oxidoreductase RutF
MSEKAISDALKMFPYGFYALGSRHGDEQNIMVLNWVTQASFEPQLMAVAIQISSFSYGLIEHSGQYVLNLFKAVDQTAIEGFTKPRAKNPEKMAGAAISAAPMTGAPVLDAAAAFLECSVRQRVETGGDHDIFLAEIISGEVRKPGKADETLNLPEVGWSYAG